MMSLSRTGFALLATFTGFFVFAAALLGTRAVAAELVLQGCKNDAGQPVYGAECGFLRLAENPDQPQGRQLDIHVMRIPAIRDTQKPPLFFIAGGPGQAAADLAGEFRYVFGDLLVNHDFIFVDQRGTGKSAALDCDIAPLQHLDKTLAQQQAIALEEQRRCVEGYRADLRFYTTPYAVTDLVAVADALDYPQLLVWGGSYGTRVALQLLREHGDRVAGAVLDGVAPVALQLPRFASRDANAALDALLKACEMDASCAGAFPQLRQNWRALLGRLRQSPGPRQFIHPRNQTPLTVYLDDEVLSAWVRLLLYAREVSPLLPLALARATAEDFSLLFTIAMQGAENMQDALSEGLHLAVLCAEDQAPAATAELGEPPLLALQNLMHLGEQCKLFPSGHLDAGYFSPVESAVPTLLLSGRFDPVTPARWAEAVAEHLSHARHIRVEGGHHIVSTLGCMPRLIMQFFSAPQTLDTLDTQCVDTIQSKAFFIDSAGPEMQQTSKDKRND